jgi:protein O-GlcNAc transferase
MALKFNGNFIEKNMAHSLELLKAVQLLQKGQHDLARQALEILHQKSDSESCTAVRYLAHIEALNNHFEKAIALLAQAHIDFGPEPKVLTQLAEYNMKSGDYDRAIGYANQSLQLMPNNPVLRLNLASWLSSRLDDPTKIRQIFEDWCHDYLPHPPPYPPLILRPLTKGRRLKIGYLSGDLKNHAVRYFIEPYFRHHDRKQFEVHAFMTLKPDTISDILRGQVEHWHEVEKLSNDALLEKIQQLGIDVLVDLSGHTQGHRLEVFAQRAAPVQVTWWGFVQTLGLRQMDYRLTDSLHCPPTTDAHYTEKLLRMKCFTAYAPPLNSEQLFPSPRKLNGYVTMVSMNHSRKISQQALLCWRDILIQNPTAALLIVSNERTESGANVLYAERLRALDMPMTRVAISPRLSMLNFMHLASIADFALDSMPISGGVTTFHSLWMGLPVLTLAPPEPIALRSYTANILKTIGMDECVANSLSEYGERASQWIQNPEVLDRLRLQCRPLLQQSPFMQHAERVRELEALFTELHGGR